MVGIASCLQEIILDLKIKSVIHKKILSNRNFVNQLLT